jgi:tetratricopeptide (TPR) repeat protein
MTETVAFLMEEPPSFRSVPTNAELRRATAAGQQRRELWSQARRELERALAAEPGLHEAGLRLGRVLLRLQKHEEATARLEAALGQDPQPALRYLAHLFLGRIHEHAGRRRQAEGEYRKSLEIAPGSPIATVALAHLRETEGELATARELLERVVAPANDPAFVDPYWEYYAAIWSLPASAVFDTLRGEAQR